MNDEAMFPNEPSDTPHQAYVAYLDRIATADEASDLESGHTLNGRNAEDRENQTELKLLSEEEFCAQLAQLDELSLRELEGRISEANLERIQELQLLLLGQFPEAWGEHDVLDHGAWDGRVSENQAPGLQTPQPSGARSRRDRWRHLRRGDRSTGE